MMLRRLTVLRKTIKPPESAFYYMAKPVWAEVVGDFRPRGGIATVVTARWPRPSGQEKPKFQQQ